jgi:hypothetical protein
MDISLCGFRLSSCPQHSLNVSPLAPKSRVFLLCTYSAANRIFHFSTSVSTETGLARVYSKYTVRLKWASHIATAVDVKNRLCGLVVRVLGYRSGGLGSIPGTKKKKLHGLSPPANYTDRATAACRRCDCQLVRIEGATWSAWRIPPAVFLGFLDRSRYFSIK